MSHSWISYKVSRTLRLCNFTEKLIKREVIKVSAYTLEAAGPFAWKHKPPLHNSCTFHHHRSQVQACPFYCCNSNKADAIYQLWGEERTFTFSWTNIAAGCFSYAGKGNTISHTPLRTAGVQGKLMGFRTLLDLIHGSNAGHHYSNVI